MSESKHTEGEWVVDRTEKYYRPCVRMNGMIMAYLPDTSIGLMTGKEHRQAEDRANAALIAAAPDLLAALEAIMLFVETCSDCDGTGCNPRHKADACRYCGGVGRVISPGAAGEIGNIEAAIARAKGEK